MTSSLNASPSVDSRLIVCSRLVGVFEHFGRLPLNDMPPITKTHITYTMMITLGIICVYFRNPCQQCYMADGILNGYNDIIILAIIISRNVISDTMLWTRYNMDIEAHSDLKQVYNSVLVTIFVCRSHILNII